MPRTRRSRRALASLMALATLLVLVAAPGARALPRRQETDSPPAAALDGVLLAEDEAAEVNARLPVAVMVDNLPEGARPQIGLDRADLVYELLVEGGITRFLAVYQQQEAGWIEPVRSVRTPFLYLVSELDAVLAHVGAAELEGDTDAGTQMRDWEIRHVEERFNPDAFRRDRTRAAPHNAVTSTAGVRATAGALGWAGPPRVEPWLYKDDLTVANALEGITGHLSFGFALDELPARPAFAVEWYYDPTINGYRRWMAGRPHADGRTGETLAAKNVIVQFAQAAAVNHEGHVLYDSVGEGPAWVFLDGQVLGAHWSKPAREARTRYYDANGDEIRFNRGPTWVALLPHGSPFDWDRE